MNYNNDYEFIYMVKENEEVFECFLKKYEPLFKKLARSFVLKYKNKCFDFQDILQQCRIIFCRAVDNYNCNNDVLFYSYLMVCLKKGLTNYVCRNSIEYDYNYMELENYDNLECFTSSYDAYQNYIDCEVQNDIIKFKHSLSFLDSAIFELRYNNFSYKDIASLLEIDVKKVDNILFKIRKKLEKHFLFS